MSAATKTATRTIPFGRPLIGEAERRAVLEVLEGPTLTHGPRVVAFEEAFANYVGAGEAIAVASCTAGLHMAYVALGLQPGDEVIVPAQTHTASAHAVELAGGRCVFVDAEPHTGNIDLDRLEDAITPRTRAICVVHYLGMPVDMERVREIAGPRNLPIVEDCALALGTTFDGTHAGLLGDVGCFSFYPVKHMTTAEGGMVITRHAELARKIRKLRAFGIDRNVVSERPIPGHYDVQELGFNYRMNELSAALGLVQLQRVPAFLHERAHHYADLTAGLRELEGVALLGTSRGRFQSSYYCLSVLLGTRWAGQRDDIILHLRDAGVGTSIYYPQPVPLMTYYQQRYGHTVADFPVATRLSWQSIALPVGPHLEPDDIEYMLTALRRALAKTR